MAISPSHPIPNPAPQPRHLYLSVQLLQYPLPPISVNALIDCGASGNFVDPVLLDHHHLTTIPHPTPIQVELIDGSAPSAGPITHFYTGLLRCLGSHTETLQFDVTRLAHFPMVLGYPWLQRHNPSIDWQAGVLRFTSPHCQSECLPAALSLPTPLLKCR